MKLCRTWKELCAATLLLSFLLLGCNMPQPQTKTPDIGSIVAKTQTAMAVSQFLTATTPPQNPLTTPDQLATSQSTPIALLPSPSSQIPVSPGVPIATQSAPQTAAPNQPSCTNMAKFEAETIPDGSLMGANQNFMKTWTLRNVGTCTWSPEYSLVYIKGEQMGGTSPAPIGQSVPPGEIVQIYLPQQAPDSIGVFQGFWKLRTPAGIEFGLGKDADVAFWVKILVSADAVNSGDQPFQGPQNLGAPSWIISFDNQSSPWYLGTNDGIDFDIDNGLLAITTSKPTGDRWRVAQPGYLGNFFLQVKFQTGQNCEGKDGYGLLVRAPNQPNNVIDSGYVFSFACDGKYRVYRIDNGSFEGLQNWTSSAALKIGANQSNLMGIYAKDDVLQFYANGILVYEIKDDTYQGGLFGLMIRSEITENFRVFVDEVSSWDLN